MRGRRMRSAATRATMAVLACALLPTAAGAANDRRSGDCVRIANVTAFSPRDEVYVEVVASCQPHDFEAGDPVIAYVEVLLSDLPPATEAVRVYASDPEARSTVVYEDLPINRGDQVLVRIVNSGEIVSIRTILAP